MGLTYKLTCECDSGPFLTNHRQSFITHLVPLCFESLPLCRIAQLSIYTSGFILPTLLFLFLIYNQHPLLKLPPNFNRISNVHYLFLVEITYITLPTCNIMADRWPAPGSQQERHERGRVQYSDNDGNFHQGENVVRFTYLPPIV